MNDSVQISRYEYDLITARAVELVGSEVKNLGTVRDALEALTAARAAAKAAGETDASRRLAEIEAAANADAADLEKMRDGTKLTRSGLVSIITYQQQELAAARAELTRSEKAYSDAVDELDAFRIAARADADARVEAAVQERDKVWRDATETITSRHSPGWLWRSDMVADAILAEVERRKGGA